MPSLKQLRSLAASVLVSAVLTSAEEKACTGENCDVLGDRSEEEAALLQVHRANASGAYKNPCGAGYSYLPKQSTQKDCQAAGFQYVGNKDGAEDASQCCVKATWTCNLGTKRDCKKTGPANPKFLGVITWTSMVPKGNCCVPPSPTSSKEATWTMDTALFPKENKCKNKKVSKDCTIDAFWTGDKCMTTANVKGKYQQATCKKTWGKCSGLDLGDGICCTC